MLGHYLTLYAVDIRCSHFPLRRITHMAQGKRIFRVRLVVSLLLLYFYLSS
jgi:hypothetical protein